MTLDDWLSEQKMSRAAFAEEASVHPVTVSKWIKRRMQPRAKQYEVISKITQGAVTPNDFMLAVASTKEATQ